ncbi:MAG: hypothetical protein AAF447_08565 [Myxococcota bacterium]
MDFDADRLLDLLRVVRRELGAKDARLELTLEAPEAERVYVEVGDGPWRLVVVEPEGSRAEAQTRLAVLAGSFAGTLETLPPPGAPALGPRAELDEALAVLRRQAAAEAVIVVDGSSPELWGADPRPAQETAGTLQQLALVCDRLGTEAVAVLAGEQETSPAHQADVDRARMDRSFDRAGWERRVRLAQAVDAARRDRAVLSSHHGEAPFVTRRIGGAYRLVLVYGRATFSELHAEAALTRAAPAIETLVERLPPLPPADGTGGDVIAFRKKLR